MNHLTVPCSPIASVLPLKFKSRKSNYSLWRASTTLYTSCMMHQSLLYICTVLENTIRWEYMWELDNTPAFESVTKNLSYCIMKEMCRLKSTSNSTCVRRDNTRFSYNKIGKPFLSRWLTHIAMYLRVRNEKTIRIAPARIFILWKELIYFRWFESQREAADSTD